MISFGPTEEQELIRDTVRGFAQSQLREMARDADEASRVPDDLLARSWELGLANGSIPEELGGGGIARSPVTSAIVLEELGCGDVSLGAAAMAPALFVHPVVDFGTIEQQEEYLPLFTRSEYHVGAVALHEPNFGYDAANMQAIAEPKGEAFSITGKKRLVAMGDRASHFLVVARGAREGLNGLEAFIVPRDAKGLTIAPDAEKTLGFNSLPKVALDLDRVEVPATARLGGERGIDGAQLVNSVRLGSVALGLGLARGILEYSIPYAKERIAFGGPIAKKQTIAFWLADMQIEISSIRWLLWKAASQLEQGLDATKATVLATTYAKREIMRIADNGLQIFGGHGYIRDYPVEMWYRNARAITILEAVSAL